MNPFTQPETVRIEPPVQPRRVTATTVLAPLGFGLLHILALMAASFLTFSAYLLFTSLSGSGFGGWGESHLERVQDLLQNSNLQYVATGLACLVLIPVYLIYLRYRRRRQPLVLMTKKAPFRVQTAGVGMALGALGLVNLWVAFLEFVSQYSPYVQGQLSQYSELSDMFGGESGNIVLQVVSLVILVPIAEELLFRGILMGELSAALPLAPTLVIQALVFAVFHFQPVQSSYVIFPAFALGLAYHYSRSIWVPILMHMVFNFVGGVVPGLLSSQPALAGAVVWAEIGFIAVGVFAALYLGSRHRDLRAHQSA